MEKQPLFTPNQLEQICVSRLRDGIKNGFHKELNLTEDQFMDSYNIAKQDLLSNIPSDGMPALVEPRIPFFDQAKLLGLGIDPAIFTTPIMEYNKPYGVWLNIIQTTDSLVDPCEPFSSVMKKLPKEIRVATPFEAISVGSPLLDQKPRFIVFPGGRTENHLPIVEGMSQVSLAFEEFLGERRITYYYLNEYDGLGGLLVAQK